MFTTFALMTLKNELSTTFSMLRCHLRLRKRYNDSW